MFSMLAPSLTTGKHTLKYFYTSVSGDKDFTAVGLIDDVQFMYFDINTRKASPKTEWVRQNENSDYWKRQTGSLIVLHHWILNNIWTESAGMLDTLSQVHSHRAYCIWLLVMWPRMELNMKKMELRIIHFLLLAERIFK